MVDLGFMEYQTPTLTASSPEGARDFLVPSRRHPGKFYALPQAPQMFKQIIMVSGFDRYFQIAPCYRDEDARADRSPGEFYQLDLEMSFVTQDDVFAAVESSLLRTCSTNSRRPASMTPAPFPRLTYEDAMLRYGTDKPDLRNPLEIRDLTGLFAGSGFKAFAGKTVRAIRIPEAQSNRVPSSTNWKSARRRKARPVSRGCWSRRATTLKGPIAKFLTADDTAAIISQTGSEAGGRDHLSVRHRYGQDLPDPGGIAHASRPVTRT